MQLYRTHSDLTDTVANYALDVLNYSRQSMVFFATRRHCDLFRRALLLRDLDLGDAIERGQITFVYVEDVLPKILKGDQIDRVAFQALATEYLTRARRDGEFRHVHVFGEIVNVLWHDGKKETTLQLENLWNELRSTESFTLYCAFQVEHDPSELLAGDMKEVLCTHSAFMNDGPTAGMPRRRVFEDLTRAAQRATTVAAGFTSGHRPSSF